MRMFCIPPVASRALLGMLPDEFVQIWVQTNLGILLGLGPGISQAEGMSQDLAGGGGAG